MHQPNSLMAHSLLLSLFLLFTSIHAIRDSQFFAKTSRSSDPSSSIAEQPTTLVLPPQSQNGYGLYARDHENFNNNNNNNNVAYRYKESNTIPSTFTNSEFSTNSIPSGYTANHESYPNGNTNAEFSTEIHDNNIPSSFTTTTSEYNTNSNNNNNIPLTFSDEEFRRYESRNYPSYDKQQYGMSDTRFLENGKYFYDVNAEGNTVKGNNMRYQSTEYKNNNEMEGYENGQESQEEYVP